MADPRHILHSDIVYELEFFPPHRNLYTLVFVQSLYREELFSWEPCYNTILVNWLMPCLIFSSRLSVTFLGRKKTFDCLCPGIHPSRTLQRLFPVVLLYHLCKKLVRSALPNFDLVHNLPLLEIVNVLFLIPKVGCLFNSLNRISKLPWALMTSFLSRLIV